jgi:hypothetical protein
MGIEGTCEICGGDTVDYECLRCIRRQRDECLATLKAIEEAGRGLFLVLDPRAGVGEKLSIVWDRLRATIASVDA